MEKTPHNLSQIRHLIVYNTKIPNTEHLFLEMEAENQQKTQPETQPEAVVAEQPVSPLLPFSVSVSFPTARNLIRIVQHTRFPFHVAMHAQTD